MLEWVSMRVAIVFWADALEQRGYYINNSDYLQKARKYGHFTGYKN